MTIRTTYAGTLGIFILTSMLAAGGCSKEASHEEAATKAAVAPENAKEHAAPAQTGETSAARRPAKRRVAEASPVPAEPSAPPAPPPCPDCGVVVSVKEIEVPGKGSGLGVIAGGVAGGLLGNQVGQGTGRDLATVAGVVGGAIAGNKIEENVKKTRVYDVTVRMENGEERIVRFETAPGVMAGDKVRVAGGSLTRR